MVPIYPSPRSNPKGRVPPGPSDRAPGVWVLTVWLALLQYVDDVALFASSPQELQHLITVIARYCANNRPAPQCQADRSG